VGTKQLKKNAVISTKVKDGALKASDLGLGQLPRAGSGSCTGTCTTLTNTFERMGTPATVTTAAGGKLSAFAAVGVYQQVPLVGQYSEAECKLVASGPGIAGQADISETMYTEIRNSTEDDTIALAGSRAVGAGTYTVGVYCLGLQAPGETTSVYNVNVVALTSG